MFQDGFPLTSTIIAAESPEQRIPPPETIFAVGSGLTLTTTLVVSLHPRISVPTKIYYVLINGVARTTVPTPELNVFEGIHTY